MRKSSPSVYDMNYYAESRRQYKFLYITLEDWHTCGYLWRDTNVNLLKKQVP
jgi:hypothetical protein